MFTWKPLIDRWVVLWVLWPRFGNPGASGFLKLVCRKLSELHKSRSGYCCMSGKESKRYDSTSKQTRQVCRMKGQVSKVPRWCKGIVLVLHLAYFHRWAGGNKQGCIFSSEAVLLHCSPSCFEELLTVCVWPGCRLWLWSFVLLTIPNWFGSLSSDKHWSDGVARAVLSQLRRSLPGGAEMDWGE